MTVRVQNLHLSDCPRRVNVDQDNWNVPGACPAGQVNLFKSDRVLFFMCSMTMQKVVRLLHRQQSICWWLEEPGIEDQILLESQTRIKRDAPTHQKKLLQVSVARTLLTQVDEGEDSDKEVLYNGEKECEA